MCPGFDDLVDSVGDWFGSDDEPVIGQEPDAPRHPYDPPVAAESSWTDTMLDAGRGFMDEGAVSLLLDPEGTIDRQQSKRELASKLNIIGDDDDGGVRLPNEVTAAEFEHLTRVHSDIRLGRSDIQIRDDLLPGNYTTESSRDEFRTGMLDDIGDIMQTESGRELLGKLHDNRQTDADGETVHRRTHLTGADRRVELSVS